MIEGNIEFVDLLEKYGSKVRFFMSFGYVFLVMEFDEFGWVVYVIVIYLYMYEVFKEGYKKFW